LAHSPGSTACSSIQASIWATPIMFMYKPVNTSEESWAKWLWVRNSDYIVMPIWATTSRWFEFNTENWLMNWYS
jgi:hypothetical protein